MDKKLKRFTMPERTGDPDLIDSLDVTPPKEDLPAHQKPGLSLTVSSFLLPSLYPTYYYIFI